MKKLSTNLKIEGIEITIEILARHLSDLQGRVEKLELKGDGVKEENDKQNSPNKL